MAEADVQQAEIKAPTKVFISYSWDSEEHKTRVLQLANTLRNPWGIETDIDQYIRARPPYTPLQGWDLWMEKRIEWAEFVLIVCTETYRRRFRGDEEPGQGRGVTWEGTIIRQYLYNDQLIDTKFIPVVFSSQHLAYVPLILNAHDKYILEDEESFRTLGYRLRKEPTVAMPEIAAANLPPPPEPVFWGEQQPSIEPPPVSLDVAQLEAPTIDPNTPDSLRSDRHIDYTPLRDLLQAGKWREADQETADKMCEVMGRRKEDWLRVEDIEQFPGADLRTIDQLWVKYSQGKFGFSVQKQIWQDCGSPTEPHADWEEFCDRVAWKVKGKYIPYSKVTFDASAPEGHLPFACLFRGGWRWVCGCFSALARRS